MIAEMSLYDYWRVLRRRKWVTLTAAAATVFFTHYYTSRLPVVYKTSVLMRMVHSQLPEFDTPPAVAVHNMEAPPVAEEAASRTGLLSGGLMLPSVSYRADLLEDSEFIRITVSGSDPVYISRYANALAQACLEYDLEQKTRQVRTKLSSIDTREKQVRDSLTGSEKARQRFLENYHAASHESSLSSQLMELEIKQKELLSRYTGRHPDVVDITEKIQVIKDKLVELPAHETELSRLTREVRKNDEIYTTLSKEYEETRILLNSLAPSMQVVNPAETPSSPASPNKPRNYATGLILGIVLGVALAFVMENMDLSITNIEDLEKFTQLPVIGLVPSIERADGGPGWSWKTLFSRSRAQQGEALRNMLIFSHDPKSKMAEPFHILRANILSKLGRREGGSALVFSSSGAAEGKTLCALNFSIAAANAGLKVLLIDTDLRGSSLYGALHLSREPGLVDVVSGAARWQDVVHGTADFLMGGIAPEKLAYFAGIDNLKILTCGRPAPSKVSVLESESIPRLIKEWCADFDLVVFDTPPVLLFVDAIILSKLVDGIVLVYSAGKVSRMALKRTREQLGEIGKSKLLGAVINNLTPADDSSHHATHYSHYS
ncbi:MAG: GNVR domain-containing protein [Elusimicrobiales bacterium]